MKKNTLLILVFIIAVVIISSFYYFLKEKSSIEAPETPRNSLKELKSVEITEYEGKDLSSITDFRENSIKGAQYVDRDQYFLKIKGLVGEDKSLTYDEVVNNNQSYEKVVTLDCVEGWSVTILWEGFLVKDIIRRAEVPDSVKTIILRAYDGYSTSFPVEYVYDNDIIIAYKMNGVELPPERGFPFQLVAESKYGYKWIKWITEIEFSESTDYKGYWESRGYSNSGNLDENFLSR